jgi:hypothetical protein
MGEMRNAYKILVRKSEWKRTLGRIRRRWEDNIRLDLSNVWWKGGYIWLRIGTSGGPL